MRLQPWTEPQLMAHEDAFEVLVEKAVKATMRTLATQLRDGALTAAVSLPGPPPETAPPVSFTTVEGAVMATWTTAVQESLVPFLADTFVTSAERVVAGVGGGVDALTNIYARQFLAQAQNRMVGIGEGLWQKLRSELVDGFQAGDGIDEIASRLQQVAALATPRALTVARTEIISAANAGSYLQMLSLGFDEGEVTKVWLATEDPRTRKSHRHADNQGVDLTGEFSVDIYHDGVKTGTEFLEFPGDPSGTPGNIINCRCSLAFDFAEDDVLTADGFVEAEHPRDKDGKFKKKGAPDKYFPIPDTKPSNSDPAIAKISWMVEHKWDSMPASQKGVLIKAIKEPDWQKLSPAQKQKIKDAPSTTSHPEAKKLLEKDVEKLDAFDDEPPTVKEAVEKLVKEGLPAPAGKRALGGTDAKTGKALAPGKPVKLKVQFLFNTKFDDGAIMAVRGDERLVWDGKNEKILRQKKGADGKFATTDTKTRGAAYAAWKDEDGWTIPDSATLAPQEAEAPAAPSVGKPVDIKVQLIYQTDHADGATVAVKPSTGEKITWDAGKKRMIVHAADGSTKEFTRGALYKAYKDDKGWHLPGADTPAAASPEPPAPAKKAVPPAKSAIPKIPATPKPVTPINSPNVITTDDEILDIKELFDQPNAFVDDLLYENPDIKIEKYTDTTIKVTSKHTPDYDAVFDIDDLSGAKLDDFGDNDPHFLNPPAPVSNYVMPEYLGDGVAEATISAAIVSPSIPAGTVLFKTKGADRGIITKTGPGMAEVKFSSGSPAIPLTGVEALDSGTIMQKFLDSKVGTPVSIPPPAPNVAPAPSQSVLPGQAPDFDALKSTIDSSAGGDKIFENDAVAIVASKKNLWFYPKDANGKIQGYDKEDIPKTASKAEFDKTYADVFALSHAGSAPASTAPVSVPEAVGFVPDPADLKFTGHTLGTHGGKVYKDSSGQDWLFKGVPSGFEAAAEVDVVTGVLHEKLGLPTPSIAKIKIDGKTGSLQKMLPGSTTPWGVNFNPASLSIDDVLAVQKEDIFDWLTANHDAHAMNLLKTKSGQVVGIDKGQAFKWLGQDKLSYDFKPNEHPQAANVLYKAHAKGVPGVKLLDPKNTPALEELLDKIQSIPDDEYKAILRPYAEQAAKDGKLGQQGPNYFGLGTSPFPANDVDAFLDYAVKRKNTIKADYQSFIDKIISEHQAATGTNSPINPPSVSAPSQPTITTPLTSKPFKMSHTALAGAGSKDYKHGQVIAENPSDNARLYWNATTKKFVVQQQDITTGKWTNIFSYNKSAAYANLKDDPGWVTPSTPFIFPTANTPGEQPTPSLSAPLVHTLSPQKPDPNNKPKALFGNNPKFTVEELKAQADKRNTTLTDTQKNELYTSFRNPGGMSSKVTLSAAEPTQFESLLRTYVAFNKKHPGNKISMLQVLRAVDEIAAGKANAANSNAFENRLIAWLKTEAGQNAAIKIAEDVSNSAGASSTMKVFNDTLKKFVATAKKRVLGTGGWKQTAKLALDNQTEIQPHKDGQQYPFVTSKGEGTKIGQEMAAKYGNIPSASLQAIKNYTGSLYTSMNSYMRSFGHNNVAQGDEVRKAEKGMKPSTRAITVYRNSATVFDDTWQPNIDQLQSFVGVTFREDAFASTSIDGQIFNGHKYRFVIEVPEGTPLAWVDDFSKNQGEKEFVLGSGLHYEILEIIKGTDWTGPGATTAHKAAVIRMRVVPPPPDSAALLGA